MRAKEAYCIRLRRLVRQSAHREQKELSPYYIIPYIDVDLLNKIVLKDKFYEIFEELGLNYPKTYVYECGKENDLKFDFDYPVIAKPANSAMYHYAKFDGKKRCSASTMKRSFAICSQSLKIKL